MTEPKNQKKAYIYALCSVLLWSTVATAFKLTLRFTNYSGLLLISTFFSFVSLSIVISIEKKWAMLFSISRRDLIQSIFLGLLNPFLYYLLIFKAYSVLPAQIAQPLNQIWGVVIVLLSIPLLKQRIGFRSIAGVIISFFGVVVLSTRGGFSIQDKVESTGIIFALLSSVVWSLFWIYNTRSEREPVISLFINFGAGFTAAFIYCLLSGDAGGISAGAVAGSLYIGLFEMGLTFLLWLKALRYSVTTAKISVLIYLAPFLSLVFIRYILGERILLSSLTGLIFIISGILLNRTDKISRVNNG